MVYTFSLMQMTKQRTKLEIVTQYTNSVYTIVYKHMHSCNLVHKVCQILHEKLCTIGIITRLGFLFPWNLLSVWIL